MTDPLFAMKIAVLESLVVNLFATGFEHQPDPVAAARAFSEQMMQSYDKLPPEDPRAVLLTAVWQELLDRMVAEVVRRTPST